MDATGGSGSNSPVWPILETPSSDDTTNENIAKFEVASKSNSSTSKLEKVTTHKVVTQKVQTKPFPAKIPVLIRNCILGLAAGHTWACIDPRLDSRKSTMDNPFTPGSNKEDDNVKILQSCNGLLMCSGSGSPAFDYVYNPCTNLFKRLPQPENSHDDSLFLGRNFLQSFSGSIGSYDPMFEQIDILGILHLQGRLFKSRGCLLLVCRDDIDSKEFTIYEMMKGCSVLMVRDDIGSREFTIYEMMQGCLAWAVRYLVNIKDFMNPLPEVINLSGKVVKYNLISKTINEIFDIGSNQMDDDDVEFIPPFQLILTFMSSFRLLQVCDYESLLNVVGIKRLQDDS
ncbi:hypothetical protein Tco_0626453 [Tanacetum coccineum]|uniref:Uncharacterized protein n=1 Tax=Tanacetum coccineum TaxID=301880 RepID=A0ABQ4WJQ1_9ASTR